MRCSGMKGAAMKKRKTLKRVMLVILVALIALQVPSYWQFRFMLSAYFDQSGDASDSSGAVAYPLIEPFIYVFEVAMVRIYHQHKLTSGGYPQPEGGWEAISADGVHKVVSGVYLKSGNSNNVGGEKFGYDQYHGVSCSNFNFSNCFRRYLIFDNNLCSFQSDIYISFNKIRCQQFFIDSDGVYSDFGGENFRLFASYGGVVRLNAPN